MGTQAWMSGLNLGSALRLWQRRPGAKTVMPSASLGLALCLRQPRLRPQALPAENRVDKAFLKQILARLPLLSKFMFCRPLLIRIFLFNGLSARMV